MFRGILTEAGIQEFFHNLTEALRCTDNKLVYAIVSKSSKKKLTDKNTITTLSFELVCNCSLMIQQKLHPFILDHLLKLNTHVYPPIILHIPEGRQNAKRTREQDWLSKNWKMTAAILGSIAIALCIVLVAEIAKIKYRKLYQLPDFT
ncbi:uncharacterized protein LOC134246742 [Saccostrea cucullata]|uniref:uncharacterized protein LOC134246742 n=1 Tax=Saccostrea cuccullata TaxID=36930 RepID=UPI002ED443FA